MPRSAFWALLLVALSAPRSLANTFLLSGRVVDGHGQPVQGARVLLSTPGGHDAARAETALDGRFQLGVNAAGRYQLRVEALHFQVYLKQEDLGGDRSFEQVELSPAIIRSDSITVTADVNDISLATPDPSEKVFVRQDLLDANPGRPGAPVSIPGYPIETASSGIKAPQYFAPGVAGDHGEPIAQFIGLGAYLVPNNLSANAHGNGYADPNILIPETIESVAVDGGAFNVQQGNHSVNLAATYGLRSRLAPFLTITGDPRDIDLVTGFNPGPSSWIALQASYGNGFLDRLEHRQQYKSTGERFYHGQRHQLALLGLAYYGFSYVPGLVPIYPTNAEDDAFPNLGDTIDPRQKDQTHTALFAANDLWQLAGAQRLSLSGFFRTYNLSLFSDFGQGLIRQSEFRTAAGASAAYTDKVREALTLLAGLDWEREAPRRDNLDHYDFYTPGDPAAGAFTKVDSNDVTISPVTPYAAAAGSATSFFRYYAGWRRDQIDVDNEDLLHPGNSFHEWVGLNSPKATVSFLSRPSWITPDLSLSYGESFYTQDPRIGTGSAQGSAVATAHSFQLVANKSFDRTDCKVTLGHTTSSAELAKLDPDTGLQFDLGPSRLLFLTAVLRQSFPHTTVLATFSKADARDLDTGQPVPEAPRTLGDLVASTDRLPWALEARGEFEYVGSKPLGTGCLPNPNAQCTGRPVKELRAAVVRPFFDGRMHVGINMLLAGGFTGQTTENFYPSLIQEVVGVRIPSYASVNLSWTFGTHRAQ